MCDNQERAASRELGRRGSHIAYPLRPYPPLIINAAITGMVPRRARVPDLPVTPDQIIEDASRCFAAGATIVHLHARAADESPEWRREAYEAFIPQIRARCPGIVVCVTTSGRTFGEIDKRADVLALEGDARPDMASLTLGSLNFRDVASVNSPESIRALATRMAEAGIRPELEIFDTGWPTSLMFFVTRDCFRRRCTRIFCLGRSTRLRPRCAISLIWSTRFPPRRCGRRQESARSSWR